MNTLLIVLAIVGFACWIRRLRNKRNIRHCTSMPLGPQQPVSSNIQYNGNSLPDDWMSNPAYWWMVGNIYNDDWCDHAGFGCDPSAGYGGCHHPDWITDPNCAHMPGNIYDFDNDPCNPHHDSFLTDCNDSHDDDWTISGDCFDD